MSTFVKGEKIKYPTITDDMLEYIDDENSQYVFKLSKSKFDLTKCIGCPYIYFSDSLLPIIALDESVLASSYSYSLFDGTVWMLTSVQVIIESIDDEYFGIKLETSVLQSPFGASTATDNNVFDKIGLIESVKEQPESEVSEEAKTNFKTNMGSFADWNAKEGEAGYIENKPFYEHVQSYRLDDVDKIDRWGYISLDNPAFGLIYDSAITVFKDEIFSDNTTYSFGACRTTLCSRAEELGCVVIEREDGRYELVIPMYWEEGLPGLRVVYSEASYNAPLPSRFLPDTVLKTTPQTLTDADKNKALANLGIDPVVWKYLCNPCIIKQGKKVPEELIGEYAEYIGDNGGYLLKYPNLAMYKIMITSNGINIDFDGPASVIITPSDINEWCLGIQDIYISKDYGVYSGCAYIDEDKNWMIN